MPPDQEATVSINFPHDNSPLYVTDAPACEPNIIIPVIRQHKCVSAIPATQSRTDAGPYAALNLDLDARIADLDALLRIWHANREAEERDAAAEDAREDARIDAEHLAQLDREEAALRDEIESGDRDRDGNFIPWARYP
jgi:hypothetical protein